MATLRCLLACCACSGPLLVGGCGHDEEFESRSHILAFSRLAAHPEPHEVKEAPKRGLTFAVGDLRLALPEGWAYVPRKDIALPPSDEAGQVWTHAWAGDLTGPRNKVGTVVIDFGYAQGTSLTVSPPSSFLTLLARATARPEDILKQYDADFELFEAVYGTVPQDYRRAQGERRELIWALLYLKKYWMMWPPCWEVATPGWKGFIGVPAKTANGPPRIHVDMLDSEGMYRGRLDLIFPDNFAPQKAAEVTARVLYWASFSGDPVGSK